MKNSITSQDPFYHVDVVTKEGKKKEYSFRESDLLLARAKGFARVEYELENNSALSANVFFVTEGKKANVSNRSAAAFRENQAFEIATLRNFGFTDWSRVENLYGEELRQIVVSTDEKRKSVEDAIKKMKEAVTDIEEAESLFDDDGFFFDWVAAIQKRVLVLQTAFECEIGYLKTA